MSFTVHAAAQHVDVPTQSARLVLLKLADCCDDDGRNIFPSVATIARFAMCSERSVQRVLKDLCAVGLLAIIKAASGRPGVATRYEMDLAVLADMRREGAWARRFGAAGPAEGSANNAEDEGNDDEPCVETGDTVSPVSLRGVTTEAERGDNHCHPTPYIPPQYLREGASGREEGKIGEDDSAAPRPGAGAAEAPQGLSEKRDGEAERGADGAGPAVTLRAFNAAWPTSAVDSAGKTEAAWAALSFAERAAALAGIPSYLAARRDAGRKITPAGSTYLAERKWGTGPAAPAPATGGVCEIRTWSREWWAVLFSRIEAGKSAALMAMNARELRPCLTVAAAEAPDPARVAALIPAPGDGAVYAEWRRWLRRRGVHLDAGKPGFWVYLPGDAPPAAAAASPFSLV